MKKNRKQAYIQALEKKETYSPLQENLAKVLILVLIN